MLLSSYISTYSQNIPCEEAIVFLSKGSTQQMGRNTLCWAEFDSMANRVANMLIDKGVKKGNRVALVAENSLSWLPIYFGILRSGAIAVLVNYRNTEDDILYCLKSTGTAYTFVSQNIDQKLKKSSFFKGFWGKSIVMNEDFEEDICVYAPLCVDVEINDNDPAVIYFSSGTTGKSKAVLISHKSLLAAAMAEYSNHRQTKYDRFLCLLPLYHAGAKIHWFGSLLVGGVIVISEGNSPYEIAETIYNEKISIAWLVVPQIQDILDLIRIGQLKREKFFSLRLMHSGAQPIPKDLITRWKSEFPNMDCDISYGLTEATGPGCINLGIENFSRIGSIGKPTQGWKIRIVDENDNDVSEGIIGELVLSGPGVMMGYYNDRGATKQSLKNGWLYTGDLARKDSDGFVFIEGRIKDVIISGGENIYPVQIENYVRKLDGIKDAAVIGIPNKRMGEIVMLVVELQNNKKVTKKEIRHYCEQLPEYQQPSKIVIGQIPRNMTEKIDKNILRNKILNKDPLV